MKTYLFNPETRIYLGEDFIEETFLKGGSFIAPPNMTTVAPPVGGHGHKMIFDIDAQCWEIHSQW